MINSKYVVELRKKLGLTIDDFAKLVGVSSRTIINYEGGGIIPVNLHPILGECVSKGYRVTSDDKFRAYTKKLCIAAGLINDVEHSVEKGGKRTIQYTPKYQLVTPHTARRSFVTNMIFRGHSFHEISSMSGHSTLEIMEIYNKVKGEDNAVKLSKLYRDKNKGETQGDAPK